MQVISLLVTTLGLGYVFRKVLSFWNASRAVQSLDGYRTLFSQYSLVANILPIIPGLSPNSNYFFLEKHAPFEPSGCDIASSVFALPEATTTLVLADADVIKEVTSSRARFPKPVEQYAMIQFYGHNIIASEGDQWKKYRKISAPAFSDRNNKLVWDETVKIMLGLFDEVWRDQDVIAMDDCLEITLPIALFVIGVAGFGKQVNWQDGGSITAGHKMTFKDALHIVSVDIMFKLFLPESALALTDRLRKVKIAFEELRVYMVEMIKDRQSSEKVERYDLFSSLLDANTGDMDVGSLTESEVVGNIYVFLLAGHETTAHTLAFTFALLAFYPDEQEKLYQHIKSILPDGRIPTYEEMPLLTHSIAVFNETLRMYPPVVNIPKYSAEDTSFVTEKANGEKLTIPVPKGTRISINTPALHYNPRYWRDPHKFDPSRFLEKDWPRDAFIPFSAGPRACLGRKFFETEGIAALTMLVSRYKITIKEEPQFSGETFDQCKERVMRTRNALTLTPLRVPLTFTRRT